MRSEQKKVYVIHLGSIGCVVIGLFAIISALLIVLAAVNLHFVSELEDDVATEYDLDDVKSLFIDQTTEILEIIKRLPTNIVSQQHTSSNIITNSSSSYD